VATLKTKTGEIITDPSKQMNRWMEHYLELYATENTVTDAALLSIPDLPTMLELGTELTIEELSKAVDCLASGNAPGNDGIPPEVIKSGKPALVQHLHKQLCLCWKEKIVPQEMRDANIITLYKNKGIRSDCNNYRCISILSIVGSLRACCFDQTSDTSSPDLSRVTMRI